MSDNREGTNLYNAVREVPKAALKEIGAGRLKGKSDINPMWRIKTLTEQFGPCGFGWKYEIVEKRLEPGANDEIAAFVDINLYVKVMSQWSEAIPGTGGSAFVAKEKGGLHVNDECFKMALTDAISVACKALGVGADVYWQADRTKYNGAGASKPDQPKAPPKPDAKEKWEAAKESLVGAVKSLEFAPEFVKAFREEVFPGTSSINDLSAAQITELEEKLVAEYEKEAAVE